MPDESAERARALSDLAGALRRLEARRFEDEDGATYPARRGGRLDWLNHWYHPGPRTPWWVFGARLGFWLLIAVGVQTATVGRGWHPDVLTGVIGVAEVGWRARAKVRAGRRARTRTPTIW